MSDNSVQKNPTLAVAADKKEQNESATNPSVLTNSDANAPKSTINKPLTNKVRHMHTVGQLEQNIDKVLKILTKTQFNEKVQIRE